MDPPQYSKFCSHDFLAKYVLQKCREIMVDSDAKGVEWYRGCRDVIAVEIYEIPRRQRNINSLTRAIMRLFRSPEHTPDILVSTILVDPMDNRVRIYLYTGPPPPSLFRRG